MSSIINVVTAVLTALSTAGGSTEYFAPPEPDVTYIDASEKLGDNAKLSVRVYDSVSGKQLGGCLLERFEAYKDYQPQSRDDRYQSFFWRDGLNEPYVSLGDAIQHTAAVDCWNHRKQNVSFVLRRGYETRLDIPVQPESGNISSALKDSASS